MSELIFVEQKPMAGKEHMPQPGTTIGREGCDINIADPEVSRNHATLRSEGGAVAIEDLGSTNGTYVNGERISGLRTLAEGDEVRLGNTVWKLQAAAQKTAVADAPAAPAPPQVTAARQVPVEPPTEQRPAEPAAPKPPAPAPPVPAGGGAPAGAPPAPSAGEKRGDVPAPDIQPSAIRRVVPLPGGPAAFQPETTPRRRGSAATRLGATLIATLVVIATAVAVVAYYVVEPFQPTSGDPDVTAAIVDFGEAVADGDGDAACELLTEDAQEEITAGAQGQDCEDIIEFVGGALDDDDKDELRDLEPEDVEVDGDTATATIPELTEGGEEEIELVQEDGDWKISDPGN